MNKVIHLVRVQLWAVLSDTLSIGNNRRKKPKVLYAGLLLFILMMSGVSFFYSFMLGSGLKMFDSIKILPSMMMTVTCIIILFTTIFKVKGIIFGFRDYDLIMSLPISIGSIVTSRLMILYALNFIFVLIMIVPMIIAYGILESPTVSFYVISLITMFFIPLVPIVIASILGTLIAYLASKFKHRNFLNILFTLGLIFLIGGFSFFMEDNGQELVDMAKVLTDQVNSLYPLAKLYMEAVTDYNVRSLLIFLLISMIAFLLYTILIKKVFKRINTLMMTGRTNANYKMGELKTSSPWKALYVKELKRYFSSSLYVLNTGFGIVMLTIGAIAFLFVDPSVILDAPIPNANINDFIPIFMLFCLNMTCTTMASISLEGRSLWILKSLPVKPMTIYLAKAGVNLTVISPALVDAILIGVVLDLGLPMIILMVVLVVVCAVFISFYGLIINLLLPNFEWTSEVLVIKQSVASMIVIFSGMGFLGIPIALLVLLPSAIMAYTCFLLLTVVITIVLYLILQGYGKKRFYQL